MDRIVYQKLVIGTTHAWDQSSGPDRETFRISPNPSQGRTYRSYLLADWEEGLRLQKLRDAVGRALKQLTDDERELIERFYYAGQCYREIGPEMGVSYLKLRSVHARALKRLRKILRPFAERYYNWKGVPAVGCVICDSPFRSEIDEIIANRDMIRPWGPVIREIRDRCGVVVKSPMTIVGHEKYH